ncbi:ABC transporter permease [Sulfobacillus harzensis]|uniref:ABC transporter permease subunit n=1 Tax=Sulfobacillus harzensis TaxID=2729629 RepID=A0A7Y0Q0T0_9FIRM|nr:ABC transporter permease subunit [Sulfobacillus harzensis]NMP21363.1 ABC transporter permease subunit [Sulfobacillus harzensis]
MPHIPIGTWATDIVTWMQNHLTVVFTIIAYVFNHVDQVFTVIFANSPWIAALIFFVLVALAVRGWGMALAVLIGGLLVQDMGLWATTMDTLALVITSGIIALAIGIPLGIWAGQSRRARTVIRPILDFMQTMPPFVYLIPAVLFFTLGTVPAVFATFIFATPPVIRLTELGLRQVPEELVEAGEAFGATTGQIMRKIKLPQAMPSILVGVNQTIMLSLSMVVIAGMIGAGGLGSDVLKGISTLNIGEGFKGGLAVVFMAIYLDRITERFGEGNVWMSALWKRSRKTQQVQTINQGGVAS